MPYIRQEERGPWICRMLELGFKLSEGPAPGVLNFVLTHLLKQWLGATPNYERLNAAIGVLECAKLELYRRVAAPYEDRKREENGDVYGEPKHTAPKESCMHPKCVAQRYQISY